MNVCVHFQQQMGIDMEPMAHRGNFSQRGFIRTVHIPYLLLALAVLTLIYLWNGLQTRNSAIAQLEESKTSELAVLDQKVQQYDVELNSLKGNFEALETEKEELQQQVVSLKREASHARAQIQRTQPLLDKRMALMDELEIQKVANGILAGKLKDVPQLKSELSYAKADSQRAQHVQAARDNLMRQVKSEKELNSQYMEQLSDLPELKHQLSSANAANARLQHVATARDNLMLERAEVKERYSREIDLQQKTTLAIARRLQELPKLKRELSFARAENQRAAYVSEARDNLRRELQGLRKISPQASVEDSVPKALKDQLARVKEENDKLQRLSKSLDQAIADTITEFQN